VANSNPLPADLAARGIDATTGVASACNLLNIWHVFGRASCPQPLAARAACCQETESTWTEANAEFAHARPVAVCYMLDDPVPGGSRNCGAHPGSRATHLAPSQNHDPGRVGRSSRDEDAQMLPWHQPAIRTQNFRGAFQALCFRHCNMSVGVGSGRCDKAVPHCRGELYSIKPGGARMTSCTSNHTAARPLSLKLHSSLGSRAWRRQRRQTERQTYGTHSRLVSRSAVAQRASALLSCNALRLGMMSAVGHSLPIYDMTALHELATK
jgi:hypothetical protein